MNEVRPIQSTTELLSDESRLQDNFTHVVNLVETLIAQYEQLQSHLALHNEAAPSHVTDLAEEILALQNENKKLHARVDVLMQQREEDTKTLTEIRRLLDRFSIHKESTDLTDAATPAITADSPGTSSLLSRHDKDEHDVTTRLPLASPIKSSESLTKDLDEPHNLEVSTEPPPVTPITPIPTPKAQYSSDNNLREHQSESKSTPAAASEKSEVEESTSKDREGATSTQPEPEDPPTSQFFSKERIDKVTQSAQTDVGSWLDFAEDQKTSAEDNDQYALDNDEFFKSIDKDEAGK